MMSEKGSRKDKNQNIQVFVRLRPLNQRERDIKSLGVIDVVHNREVVVRQSQQSSHTKKFTFDRAFGPQAKQVEIYQDVVSPLIEEVLAGYNCTVFAYGQTGTGKTHTMVGESTGDEHTWQNDPSAGIIPRALSQLFDELRLSNTEYTVRVSYLELYNEELFDLLAACEDNSKLRIYEDVTRKGSNIVNGLEEITVSNKNEVYKIMAQGQERKRVASTLMNAQSSRSHTVFTIVVHMRENSPEGEELVKIGKLNLVDLAGSENISKAGSDNPAKRERARECVNINQSLLTLGRVITALVERHPHIPYRESKLTRILQESLGGRTKTSIIATISPGHKDLEETLSTLEYANRAKNIQNKPEVNQKMTKKAILKEYAEEIDRLKRDLQASRDKNGVYLATDTFTEITLKQEEQRKEIQELLLQKRAVEEQKDKAEALFSEMNRALEIRDSELNETRSKLTTLQTALVNTANKLQTTQLECEEQKHLVEKVSQTELALSAQARELLAVADQAARHVRCLHDTVDKRRSVESTNLQVTRSYREQAASHRANLAAGAKHFSMSLAEALAHLHDALDGFATNNSTTLRANKAKLEEILQHLHETMNEVKKLTDESNMKLGCATEAQRAELAAIAEENSAAMEGAARSLLQGAAAALQLARSRGAAGQFAQFLQQCQAEWAARLAALAAAARALADRARAAAARRRAAALAQRAAVAARTQHKEEILQALAQKVERDNLELEKRLTEQAEEIQAERLESQRRLQAWMEEERRVFEERLRKHVESETAALEERLSKKLDSISQERARLEARTASHVELHERLRGTNAQETQAVMQELQLWETVSDEHENIMQSYDKDFDEGVVAIGSELEVFSVKVVEVDDHIHQQLVKAMELQNQQTEQKAQAVVARAQAVEARLAGAGAALDRVVAAAESVVGDIVHCMQINYSTTTDILTEVGSSLTTLDTSWSAACSSHQASVHEINSQLSLYEDNLSNVVANLEQVEGRCLNEEYKVYSPTGKTPLRAAYRVPRALAATSPHERVLARFRAHRDNLRDDDDCIVVESDPESRVTSDCESSASEDSALFAAPSPPLPPLPPAPPARAPTPRTHSNLQPRSYSAQNVQGGIVKCTSESDIFSIKKDEDRGKENVNRSVSYKKPSKLPAPASIKKPFIERNGTNN